MSARAAELIAVDGHQVRIGPWRGSEEIAYLAPIGEGRLPSVRTVDATLGHLAAQGYRQVVTSAVPETDIEPFQDAGFVEHERLHLLSHPLLDVEPVARRATRRGRPADRTAVLALDHQAFEPFWRLDAEGLDDALGATPVARYRVAVRDSEPVGYAVFGLAGSRGYLQRLAVRPDAAGSGLGSTLIRDGLRWLVRRRATSALVNTQISNERALHVYLRHGFVLQRTQLVVLTTALTGGA